MAHITLRLYVGALLVVGGIAAFIEAHSNHPVAATEGGYTSARQALRIGHRTYFSGSPAKGLSPTDYDLLRIGAWALLVLGVLTMVLGLLRLWDIPKRAS